MNPEDIRAHDGDPAWLMWDAQQQSYVVVAIHLPKDLALPPITAEEFDRLTADLPTVEFTLEDVEWDT